ncbi:MAG: hypothetical protein K9N06_08570 [Candidatus Cloacimonetes bacterium]|nr:hypothetical protein [Candidatus Cloacimonadota bacterium]
MGKKKARKYFFGIFEDGPVLKIAQLIVSNGHPILVDIKKTEMECSIYHDADRDHTPPPSAIAQEESNFETISDISFDDSGELDSVVNPHEHLLSIFPLNQGRISLNANDEKLMTHYLDRSLKSLSKRDLIKLSLLSQDDIRDKDVTWGLVQTAQDATCVLIHKGENRLFSYLQKYNQIQSERKYYYSLIDSNDISVVNAIRLNYEFNKEDDVLVLYLGYDYKKGILLKGEEFVKSLPILTSSDGIDLRREITSKLTLYQDELEIPHVERIIIAGEYCQDETIEAIASAFPSAQVERFRFSDLLFSENLTEELPEEELASYMIPISLAWKILAGKSVKLLQTNFLEKKVIKSQKLVQFSWHSGLMLTILLGLSFSSTNSLLELQTRLDMLETNVAQKKAEYEMLKSQFDPGPNIQAEITALQEELSQVKSFYNNKAIWSQIFEKLSHEFKNYPVSWLTNIQGNDAGFSITGTTTKQENIVHFAGIFPEGTIKSVQNSDYEDRTIWTFDIKYSYDPALPIVKSWIKDKEKAAEAVSDKTSKVKTVKSDPVVEMYRKVTESYFTFDQDNLIKHAREFIEKYPDNPLVTNCRYLMAEILYRQDKLAEAEELLNAVLTSESPMEPYALFKLAQIYGKTDRKYLAQVNLNLILTRFPKSDVIPRAQDFLKEIGGSDE